jgi:hypothetical protein
MTEQTRKHGLIAKALMPMLATLASAAASYAAKKGAHYLEQTVLPRLQDTRQETKKADPPQAGGGDDHDDINDDLERRRRERAEHRAARRTAS